MPTQVGTLVYSVDEMATILISALDQEAQVAGLQAVYYGSTMVPEYPSVVVEAGTKRRILQEVGSRFQVEFTFFVTILHEKIQSGPITTRETIQTMEAVEAILHDDYTFGNRIIFGAVTRSTPGTIRAGSVMARAHRLTWEGISKEGF